MKKPKEIEKRGPGRPPVDRERKVSTTVSLLPSVHESAKRLFGSAGNALELAVKYADVIKKHEAGK